MTGHGSNLANGPSDDISGAPLNSTSNWLSGRGREGEVGAKRGREGEVRAKREGEKGNRKNRGKAREEKVLRGK